MKQEKADSDIIALILKSGTDILTASNMKQEKAYIQHGNICCFAHSVFVAYMSIWLVKKLRADVDMESLVRGALLHDYFLYDWHMPDSAQKWHGFRHARIALQNAARDFDLNKIEIDIIRKHMFPLNLRIPRYRESFIVCLADKICAIRELSLFCRWQSVILEVESKTVSCA